MKKFLIASLFAIATPAFAESIVIYAMQPPPYIEVTPEDIARGTKVIETKVIVYNDETINAKFVTDSYWFDSITKVIIHPGKKREITVPITITIKREAASGRYTWPMKMIE